MKSKMFKRIMAASLATAMTASLAACGGGNQPAPEASTSAEPEVSSEAPADSEVVEEPTEEVGQFTALTDENGNVYALDGMEIVIRDWWYAEPENYPSNEYEEAEQEYRDWIQETYNFKIRRECSLEWGDAATEEFTNYVSTGGDDNNYVFALTPMASTTSAVQSGMMYDLATLDCLDFTEDKFVNKVHELYSKADSIYAMATGAGEPRCGIFFNKRLLEEANIDPESIYDMQANGTWTFQAWEDLCKQVHRDTNNDGEIDVYAVNANDGNMINAAVWANGGEYVGKDADGKYILKLEDPKTVEGLEFAMNILNNYWEKEPEDAAWDYYKESFVNGNYVFLPEEGWATTAFLKDSEDDWGFVMFPKGPQKDDYTNVWNDNLYVIPACYDADKAWKIAFAYNLYTNEIPGFEDYEGWKDAEYNKFRDMRAVDETIAMMRVKGDIAYDGIIPKLERGPQFIWNLYPGADLAAAIEGIKDTWQSYLDEANAN